LSKLDEISQYINQLSFDLKAEMLVATMVELKIDLKEILAAFDGQLKRVWSRDIAWSSADRLETGDNVLSLHLNRDGLYDTLPEEIFHINSGEADKSGEEMAKESMKSRAEEKEARTFFQPFENEVFLQRVQLAMMENQLLNSINSEFLTGIIPYFWKVPNSLPDDYVFRLKKLIPLVHRITGDVNLTAQCLEFIVKEKVAITASNEENSCDAIYGEFHHSGVLGKSRLGVDTISGDHVNGFIKRLLFSIGPIENSETSKRVKDGTMNSFLDCFYSYFIPFELDIDTNYIFGTEENQFMLENSSETAISYLGYNSVVQ
jgi:hypothetical protein